jgi:glutamate 5-kinase
LHVDTVLQIEHNLGYASLEIIPSAQQDQRQQTTPCLNGMNSFTHVAFRSSLFGIGGMTTLLTATDIVSNMRVEVAACLS